MKMKRKHNIKKIRDAIVKNRGGLGQATDDQILAIWNSLDEQTQKKYLDSLGNNPEKDSSF